MECYDETWAFFGDNVRKYIESYAEEFEKDSFDIILGYTRGGAILAFVISCILKDTIEIYNNPLKASVRTIPKGIVCKRVDPCFVMNQPTSNYEKKDIIENLREDLENFSENKLNEPLSILIVDDNLTGATRMKYLNKFLKSLLCVKSNKMLAYARHPEFTNPHIPTIIEFPKDYMYFSMPWHKAHKKRDLILNEVDNDTTKLRMRFKFSKDLDMDKLLVEELSEDYDVKKSYTFNDAKTYRIENGASEFRVEKQKELIYIDYIMHMFYPPKQCLKASEELNDNHKAFGDKSICSLGARKTKASCSVCSILNCNIKFIDKLVNFDKVKPSILIKDKTSSGKINETLRPAVQSWFENLMANIEIDNG